ncbi:hypothetical protein GGQ84_000962 [Desulfitispora alkaliphila]|uniref:TIGR01777 family oxidoreductase n=1 Tax=Desulfitispora alkaliphila TaxID=622674 RepID=UPI003D253D4B
MHTLIVGGTGFIGKKLSEELINSGYNVAILTRSKVRAKDNNEKIKLIEWDKIILGSSALKKVTCVVNLAGESIGGGRWTKSKKEKIVRSRLDTTQLINDAIERKIISPRVLINASAIGFYGDRGEEELSEESKAGDDFLANVCKQWEEKASIAKKFGVRVSYLRIGVVLGMGGALERMIVPYRFYMGGTIGSGNQWVSWIHINDLVEIIRFVIENESIVGPVNATSPTPVRMKEFCSAIGTTMNRPSWLRVPQLILRVGLGEMADMILNSQRVYPNKITNSGYEFRFSRVNEALEDVIKKI